MNKIVRIIELVTELEPFLGNVLNEIQMIKVEEFQGVATDGRTIRIGSSVLDKINVEQLTVVVLHELLHIVLLHSQNMLNRDPYRYNVATDIVVNDIIEIYDVNTVFIQNNWVTGIKEGILNSNELSLLDLYDLIPEGRFEIDPNSPDYVEMTRVDPTANEFVSELVNNFLSTNKTISNSLLAKRILEVYQ